MKRFRNNSGYLFIDADDTLWENERFFREAEAQFAALLAPQARLEDVQHLLWEKQEENIPYFGYGSKTYFMGMTAAALDLCGGSLPKEVHERIHSIILNLSQHEVCIFDGVPQTLEALARRFRLVLATKGETVEQITKFRRSGLSRHFVAAEVLMNKTPEDYLELAAKFGVAPEDMVMVGNSVRSDINPVIAIGGMAVYIPHEIVWEHEMAELPVSEKLATIKDFSELSDLFE